MKWNLFKNRIHPATIVDGFILGIAVGSNLIKIIIHQ